MADGQISDTQLKASLITPFAPLLFLESPFPTPTQEFCLVIVELVEREELLSP